MANWYEVGSAVVELTYFGNGAYASEPTTVERLTKAQIITATGHRFWRDGQRLAGRRGLEIAGVADSFTRLVRPDNRHVSIPTA